MPLIGCKPGNYSWHLRELKAPECKGYDLYGLE